ncbi:hypothetical protein SLEP1_g18364 [Rubroshorea leprosula]|uniref:Reverse transcriptase n=1 Tax=Rubroshorea leprosula TaxID=152421 RepID=A0AAV5J4V1_9ROSI|nr:hypothetical protein SLEP1_g18364 [Rubroshorea leprosula]
MSAIATPTLNSQEADLLSRSVKRIKGDSNSSIAEEYQLFEAPQKQLSYRDMVYSSEPTAILCDSSNRDEALEEDSDMEDDGTIPTILISREEKKRICMPWLNSLIIKAFGTDKAGYNFIFPRVKAQWKPRGKMDCIDLGLDFFLIRFHEKEDLNRVLHGGPWFVGPHFLTIRRWEPSFDPAKATFKTTAIWARLPRLPIEYYDVQILERIGNMLGTPLRLDAHTVHQSRGQYARICIQVDLDEPLVPFVRIGKHIQKVLYEGPAALCYACGCVGHKEDKCPLKIPHPMVVSEDQIIESQNSQGPVEGNKSTVSDKISLSIPPTRGKTPPSKRSTAQTTNPQNVKNNPPARSTSPRAVSDHGSSHIHQDQPYVGGFADRREQQVYFTRRGSNAGFKQKSTSDQGLDVRDSSKLLAQAHSGDERSGSHPFSSSSKGWDSTAVGAPVSRIMFHSEGSLDILDGDNKMGRLVGTNSSEVAHNAGATPIPMSIQDDRMHEDCAPYSQEGGNTELPVLIQADCAAVLLPRTQHDGFEQGGPASVAPRTCQVDDDHLQASEVAEALGFSKKVIVDADGLAGGIWLLWDDRKFCVDILNMSPQVIHANVQHPYYIFLALHSDHCPILLSLDQPYPSLNRRPFRLEKFWLEHESFKDLVVSSWTFANLSIAECSVAFQNIVKLWSRTTFDNLHKKKKELIARLGGIQRFLQAKDSSFRIDLEKSLTKEYQDILKYEEDMWFMKSRVQWIQNGDRNSRFFHVSTLKRRSNNRILGLKDGSGSWTSDPSSLESIVSSHFKGLYTTSLAHSFHDSFINVHSGPIVDPTSWHMLNIPPFDSEIKQAIFSMKPFKAPGPDGLHVAFFQKFWFVVKNKLCNEIRNIFNSGVMPESWSASLITLIPKINKPDSISQYRPIGLCNVSYKVVTKIIVLRLKKFIGDLISPMQSSFIPGRNGIDNVTLLREFVHSFHKKKGNKGDMIVKLDLEKAYDRLEWSFIKETLTFFNLPPLMIKLIMSCISSASFSCIINGGVTESFKPSRGLRQGDPLSPYLFILCLEYLSLNLHHGTNSGLWKGSKLGKSGPLFSHLFFADDLIFIGKATTSNALYLKQLLDFFCFRSGQSINQEKSKVLFSVNVYSSTRQDICQILCYVETLFLGKYLGFPISSRKIKKFDCGFIVDKVRSKLTGWKANMLSLAGRATLVSSVLASIPNYYMQGMFLPASIQNELDAISRNFIWGSTSAKKKANLVPGIGLLNQKRPHDLNITLKDILLPNGRWNLDYVAYPLPQDIIQRIAATPIQRHSYEKDSFIWNSSSNDKFSMKSAYYMAKNIQWSNEDDWSWIWKVSTIPKIQYFLWLLMHGRILTFDTLAQWGVVQNNRCPRCSNGPETLDHLFRECHYASSFWDSISPYSSTSHNQNLDFKSWIKSNVCWKNPNNIPSTWPTFFSYAIWSIWYSRNQLVHDKRQIPIMELKRTTLDKAQEFIGNNLNCAEPKPKNTISVGWVPPSSGFVKLNSDGSALGNPGMAGAGGLLRDHLGRWIIGFSRNIGWTTSIAAELWAIRDGLEVAISKGLSKIIVEIDSKIATILIESADISLHSLGILISDCRSLLGRFADAQISHIYREANTAADFMAKLGTSSAMNFVLYDGSPPGISSFLYHDCIGTVFPRIAVAV